MMASGPVQSAVVEPRLAATVLLVRDNPFEVLLVKRSTVGSFPSRRVFPGGVVEQGDRQDKWSTLFKGAEGLPADDLALRIAGLRECWEEVGLLCLADQLPTHWLPDRSIGFHPWLEQHGAHVDLGEMVDFAHWTTPPTSPKRWDTRFFLARAPQDGELCCDGVETVEAEWVQPQHALERDPGDGRGLLFSTMANLQLLAMSSSVEEAFEAARDRVLCPVTPVALRENGRVMISIPEEAGYPVSAAWFDDVLSITTPGR